MNNSVILLIGIATALGFLINLYVTPALIYFSHKHGIFDHVDDRKVHTEDTSRLGGIGIFLSFMISALASPILVKVIMENSVSFDASQVKIGYLAISVTIIFITGVLDDFAQMRARYKLLGQILASVFAILGGAVISQFQVPFTEIVINFGYFSAPLTLLWLVGITNSLNLIDGIDGLSSGISIFATMIYGFVFLLHSMFLPAIICYALLGSLFGYLFFNFPPAKIFMGDSGSLFLGFILALLPLAAFPQSPTSLALPVTMLAIPIFDVVAAIWRRKREKRNIFSPDRFHVHHKMLNLGFSNRTILAIIYGICLVMGINVIIFEATGQKNFLLLLISLFIVAIFFIVLHYTKKEVPKKD